MAKERNTSNDGVLLFGRDIIGSSMTTSNEPSGSVASVAHASAFVGRTRAMRRSFMRGR